MSVELVPLAGATGQSNSELYELVDELHAVGVPALIDNWRVCAAKDFAEKWETAAQRYKRKRCPIRGARMRKLVGRLA